MEAKQSKFVNGESTEFDRVLRREVPGIAGTNEAFKLENGYYTNEAETILCRSTDNTGKFFKKKSRVPTEEENGAIAENNTSTTE